ncbi:hypothetical protein [Bacteroides ovatus]|uniref:hypothetical protein n=1 Tax=Bacteroides ovatus TaxID=28116 RepID=UPI0039B56E2E
MLKLNRKFPLLIGCPDTDVDYPCGKQHLYPDDDKRRHPAEQHKVHDGMQHARGQSEYIKT